MENQSNMRDKDDKGNQQENLQSGSKTQMKGGQSSKQGSGSGSMEPESGRPDDVRDQSRGSGTQGTRQHVEAGNTGTSGGQVSPQAGNRGGSSSDRNS